MRLDIFLACSSITQSYFFCIHVLVEGRELYERHIDFAALPAVEADDHLMDGEKQVVIGLLQGLGDGVKLAFVAAAVVGLRLAGHRTYKVRVYAHGEADHVHGLLNVGAPVAALFGVGVKSAIKRVQSQTCLNYAKREQIIQSC